MYRLLVILVACWLSLSLMGCSASVCGSDYTINVTGTTVLAFSGRYMGIMSSGMRTMFLFPCGRFASGVCQAESM